MQSFKRAISNHHPRRELSLRDLRDSSHSSGSSGSRNGGWWGQHQGGSGMGANSTSSGNMRGGGILGVFNSSGERGLEVVRPSQRAGHPPPITTSTTRTMSVLSLVPMGADDHRTMVPPMEYRVREAEVALMHVCRLGVKPTDRPPLCSSVGRRPPLLLRPQHDGSGSSSTSQPVVFNPVSARDQQLAGGDERGGAMMSGLGTTNNQSWLLKGKAKSLKYILDERVMKVISQR